MHVQLVTRGAPARHAAARRPVQGLLRALAVGLSLGLASALLVPAPAAEAARTRSLALSADGPRWSTIGSRHGSTSASVQVIVPEALPVKVAVQLRSSSHGYGYRATLGIAADGTVTGSLGRVRAGVETLLLPATPLGLSVRPGDALRLDAAVAASKRVWVYLAARPASVGGAFPWQLATSDASRERIRGSGRTYLWASGSAPGTLRFRPLSVAPTNAGRAAARTVVPPEPGGDTFSFAVIPDTQAETGVAGNGPFLNRVGWLAANRGRFDLRYVLHTGDVTNWGWLDARQLERARAAMGVLRGAGLPYALTIGNHDTRAVGWNGRAGSTGYGGSAYMYNPECPVRLGAVACKSALLVRHTEEFNGSFPLSGMGGVGGSYQPGRADNYWTSFSANGTDWLVLTLELWARREVVAWAAEVVAAHPEANVIVQTHSYLAGNGRIWGSAGGYGSTSPQYLYEHLVSKYPNVKLVFSGHVGTYASRVDRPSNPVLSYLANDIGGPTHDPVRIVTVNTRTGDVFTTLYDPLHDRVVSTTGSWIRLVR